MKWAALLIFLLLLVPVHALDVPQPTGFVNDQAGLFTPEQHAALEARLDAISRNTTVEIAVLTIPSLEQESLEDYANRVFRQWGVGKRDVNNGLLILISRDDRRMRIEVGYGLEPVITDQVAGMIIRNRMAPAFREEDYYGGVDAAVSDILALVERDPTTVSQYTSGPQITDAATNWAFFFTLIYVGITIFAAVKYRKQVKRMWQWKGFGLLGVVLLAFLVAVTVGWLTLLFCFFVLMFTLRTGIFFGGGGRFGGGGGGFGGFGGGSSGGGGGSGGW